MKKAALVVLAALLPLAACRGDGEPHDHGDDHPEGHNHHEAGHGHDAPMIRITRWTEAHELFVEHEPAVAGQTLEMLVHVTVLDGDYRPLEGGELSLELDGPEPVEAKATPRMPGVYEIAVTPEAPGHYRGALAIAGQREDRFEGLELTVAGADGVREDEVEDGHGHNEDDHRHDEDGHGHDEDHGDGRGHGDEHAREAGAGDVHGDELIELLKEQQWSVSFATAVAAHEELVASIQVSGTVSTPPGGSAQVGAPVAGRVAPPRGGLPRPGQRVRKGQLLATLRPAPSSPEEATRATLAVAEAEARASAARAELERAERLIDDEAISQRELEDARREAQVAEEAVRAAKQAADLLAGRGGGSGAGAQAWRLQAPIEGVLAEVHATPGASVSPGTDLFRIVDDRELWLRAQVPEQDAAKLRADRDAHYRVAGLETWKRLVVGDEGDEADASIVTVGRTVDEASRTVEVIYALRDPDPDLRVGGLVQLSVPVGDPFHGVAIPRSAIVADGGLSVVYVQDDGEHFEERVVRLGPRSGDRVAIAHGLRAGERVVSRGAHVVRLAKSAASGGDAHGHIH